MTYDAVRDAAEMSRPIEEWADHGLALGMTYARRSPVHSGLHLASSDFHRAMMAGLGVPPTPDAAEMRRRLEYGERVQDALHAAEKAAIARRYRLLSRGLYLRFAASFAVLLVTAALGIWVSEIGAIGFLVLACLADILAGIWAGGKEAHLSEAALGEARSPVRLPWQRPVPGPAD
jgi:hypothetical protein